MTTRVEGSTLPKNVRMHGYTVYGGFVFDNPLTTKIAPNLWVGGVQDGLVLPDFVDTWCRCTNGRLTTAACVLIDDGLSAEEAIALVQSRRSPVVPCKPTFESFVRRCGAAPRDGQRPVAG